MWLYLPSVLFLSISLSVATAQGLALYKMYSAARLGSINGALILGDNLLIHSDSLIIMFSLIEPDQKPIIKYVIDFRANALIQSMETDSFVFLTHGEHCVKSLDLSTRDTSTLTANCSISGSLDGDSLTARMSNPRDIAAQSDSYYVADYDNQSVRRVSIRGYVSTLLTLHSKPFAITSGLYVAADTGIYQVVQSFHAFSTFLIAKNATDLKLCSLPNIYVITTRGELLVAKTSSEDPSFHLVDNSTALTFSQILCYSDLPLFINFSTRTPNKIHMELYSVNPKLSNVTTQFPVYKTNTSSDPNVTSVSIQSIPKTSLPQYATRTMQSTEQRTVTPSTTRTSSIPQSLQDLFAKWKEACKTAEEKPRYWDWKPVNPRYHSKNYSAETDELYHPDQTPDPIGNHGHIVFSHLPSLASRKSSPAIIAAYSVAGLFLALTFVGLGIAIARRNREHGIASRTEVLDTSEQKTLTSKLSDLPISFFSSSDESVSPELSKLCTHIPN